MGSFLWDTLVFSLPLFSECSIISLFFFFFFAFLHCTPIDFPHHFHFSTPTNFFSPVMGGEGGLLTLFLFPSFLPLTRASLLRFTVMRLELCVWIGYACVLIVYYYIYLIRTVFYIFFSLYTGYVLPQIQPANQPTK